MEPIVDHTPGGVWIFNGTSSSGKSSLVMEFRLLLRQATLAFAVDDFFLMGHWQIHQRPEGFAYERAGDRVRIAAGPLGRDLLAAWRRACAALWIPGVYVLVDDLKVEDDWQREWRSALGDIPHRFIAVKCDLATLEQRERDRGDREAGLARGHFADVHEGVKYDAEVDTARFTPELAAKEIATVFDVELHARPERESETVE